MLVLIALLTALFQQGPQTGTIEGTVLGRSTNAPIVGMAIKATADSSASVDAITDAAGRFVLRDVPAGRVRIEATTDGYLLGLRLTATSIPIENHNLLDFNGNLFPGRTLNFTVNLAAGQNLKLPVIPASVSGAIRGRVVDGEGHGIPNVAVAFIAEITDGMGRGRLQTEVGTTRTDDQGEYRRVLSPGNYYVKAAVDRPDAPALTVYHPATTDALTAAPVVLGEGAEATANIGVDAALNAETFKISGRVLPLPGQSTVISFRIFLKTQASPSTSVPPTSVADTATDEKTGRFELRGLQPGSYDLFAIGSTDGKEYLAKLPVEIRGRDVEDVEILLKPGEDISGRLVIEGDSNDLQLARPGAGTIRIALNRKDGLFGDILLPAIDDTGSAFTFRDVPPGEYNIAVSFAVDRGRPLNPDLYVADIRASGRSVFDNGFEVGVDKTDALEVIVGTNGGSIAGSVVGANSNQPVTVILAIEFARRSNTALVKSVAGNADGQFQMRGLTPGTYRILAVPVGTPMSRSIFESRAITVVVQKGTPISGIQVPLLSPGR